MERIPKNIRQIGEREDRVKVYLEDYVSTYLRRVQQLQGEEGAAGLLVGSWQQERKKDDSGNPVPSCVFVSGAMTVRQAGLEGGQISFSSEAWDEGYEGLGTYFSGQELCGIFVCEGSCRRFRRQALFAAVRENFPDQEALLYLLTEEGEEIVYRIRPRGEERLQGYYCYFERNEAMQDYMMDHLPERRVEWEWSPKPLAMTGTESRSMTGTVGQQGKEGVLGDPARQFRQKMDRSHTKRKRRDQPSGRGIVALCAVMAAVIVISGMGLVYRERGGIQMEDLLSRLQIDTDILAAVSAWPEETGEHYVGRETGKKDDESVGKVENPSSSLVVEEIPGNVYPTAGEAETSGQAGILSESPEETEPSTESLSEPSTESSTNVSDVARETDSATLLDQESLVVGTGVLYTVQQGDSLYSISRRFYGTEEMAAVIQQLNDLEDADLIKVGQELLLP